jgi:hypothetical protein
MTPNTQPITARPEKQSRSAVRIDLSPEIEHSWFEFDRMAVVRQLYKLNAAIDANAKKLQMIAAEGVFEKSLSVELLRTSRTLQTIAKDVTALRGRVTRASGYPKAIRKLAGRRP